MAQFLNTEKLNEWIPKLIDKTEHRLVITVPYIKTIERLYPSLVKASDRGAKLIIVYRKEQLTKSEKNKLKAIDHLMLMQNLNVHAKSYLSEKYLIIASVNMYEFYQANQHEMGVLFALDNEDVEFEYSWTDKSVINDSSLEINALIKSANLENGNSEFLEKDTALKGSDIKSREICDQINKGFVNKSFKVVEMDDEHKALCVDYFDNIDVAISHRVELIIKMDKKERFFIFESFDLRGSEYRYENFKFYWNGPGDKLCLYVNRNCNVWDTEDSIEYYRKLKIGIDHLVDDLRKCFPVNHPNKFKESLKEIKTNFEDKSFPKPFCIDQTKVDAFVLGTDPRTAEGVTFEFVFGIGEKKNFFYPTERNLWAVGLTIENVYVQNIIHEYLEYLIQDNPDWGIEADKWLPITIKEFDQVDESKEVPVLIISERLLDYLLYDEMPKPHDIYSKQVEIPFPSHSNKLGRPIIPFFEHYKYNLKSFNAGHSGYAELVKNIIAKSFQKTV